MDIQQRKAKHAHRWDDTDTDTESSLDATNAPLKKRRDYQQTGLYLANVVVTSIGGAHVVRELDRIAELRGYPCMVSDQCRS